jgi:pyruvate dehydrogenase E2 component (dihydrolipoamide acetyltransferase)
MPKWGLSMQEGAVVHWWKREGDRLVEGDDVVDIETTKITNTYEAPVAGVLRRQVVEIGDVVPVGALIAVVADPQTPDAEIDAFVSEFQARFVPAEGEGASEGGLHMSAVEVLGRTIKVGRKGTGEATPFVLIHGYGGDMNGWLFNVDALAQAAPVIALDLPGHGGSSKDVGEGSLSDLAATVRAALSALDVTEAHLVGHSLGGAIVARLAADAPSMARSITLVCPAGLPGCAVNAEFLNGMVGAQRVRDLRPYLEMLTASPDLVGKEMVEDVMKFKRLDGAEEALEVLARRLIDGVDFPKLQADLANIGQALVIASKTDRIVGAPDAARLPPGFRLVLIEGAGHLPHLETAAEVNALILQSAGAPAQA